LLAFARRQPLKPQVFNVGNQVEAVAQLIRPLVGGRIRIEVELSDTDCFAIADIAQFETALINLAVNGRDAMEGEGRLAIRVRKVRTIPALRAQSARNGDFVAIAMTDTGAGIASDHIEAIFEPFFTTKEVGRGTGQGLSIAHNVITSHGGTLDFVTEMGKGTTFYVRLPLSNADEESAVA
jgi:signal transduction histidine kinase